MRCIIHIGTHKTGSTAIQSALRSANNKSLLNSKGVYFVEVDAFSDHCLYHAFNYRNRHYRDVSHIPIGDYVILKEKARLQIFDFIVKTNADYYVFSSEHLVYLEVSEVQGIYSDLTSLGFTEIYVLAYVRKPDSFYLSHTQQMLKASSAVPNPTIWLYDYRTILQNWGNVFGGSLMVRSYDIDNFTNHSVVDDFFEILNALFGLGFAVSANEQSVNLSISAEGMIILQKYRYFFYPDLDNKFKRDSNRLVDYLMSLQKIIIQTKPRLKNEISTLILNNHSDQIKYLNENYGVSFLGGNDLAGEVLVDKKFFVEDILDNYSPEIVQKLLFYLVKNSINDFISERDKKGR